MRKTGLILCIAALFAIFASCGTDDDSHNWHCTTFEYDVLNCPAYDVALSVTTGGDTYDAEIGAADCEMITGTITVGGQELVVGINLRTSLSLPFEQDLEYVGEVTGDIRYTEGVVANQQYTLEFGADSQIDEGSIDASGVATINATFDGNEADPDDLEPRTIELSMRVEPEMETATDERCTDFGE